MGRSRSSATRMASPFAYQRRQPRSVQNGAQSAVSRMGQAVGGIPAGRHRAAVAQRPAPLDAGTGGPRPTRPVSSCVQSDTAFASRRRTLSCWRHSRYLRLAVGLCVAPVTLTVRPRSNLGGSRGCEGRAWLLWCARSWPRLLSSALPGRRQFPAPLGRPALRQPPFLLQLRRLMPSWRRSVTKSRTPGNDRSWNSRKGPVMLPAMLTPTAGQQQKHLQT